MSLPCAFEFRDLRVEEEVMVSEVARPSLFESDEMLARQLLRCIAACIYDLQVNSARRDWWKSWKGKARAFRGEADRRELLRAFLHLIGSSPRRSMITAYAVNGMFERDEYVRLGAVFVLRDSTRRVALDLREAWRRRERDPGVIDLLRP